MARVLSDSEIQELIQVLDRIESMINNLITTYTQRNNQLKHSITTLIQDIESILEVTGK